MSIIRYKKVGGLHFMQLGRFTFTFCASKRKAVRGPAMQRLLTLAADMRAETVKRHVAEFGRKPSWAQRFPRAHAFLTAVEV